MAKEIGTRCIHLEEEGLNHYGAVSFPIYQTATFAHPGVGQSTGYDYSRVQNPTREQLEKVVASLENGIDALALSSGMAAITLMMEMFSPGDHLIVDADLYGGSVRLFEQISKKNGITFTSIDCCCEEIEGHIRENTKAIYIETPTNPMMHVTDIAKTAETAKRHGLLLLVDNTFLSPYFQNPLDLGADLVVHSGTKFLGGHNDALAGFLVTNREELSERLRFLYKTTGAVLSPFDSWLILRGIKTLGVRMERAQENALAIVEWLKGQPGVTDVIYPGLAEHPGYEVMKRHERFRRDADLSGGKQGVCACHSGKGEADSICRESWRGGDADYLSDHSDPCGCAEGNSGEKRDYGEHPADVGGNRGREGFAGGSGWRFPGDSG